ncbi:hypothetical protein [Lysinibacillus capsici]|uniref:hypothetical protein n=1 Tax=Lysinibacillus capsici TaxID=2115968 RepID=UPI001CDA0CD3|nr:hypothetical protein [Lysinibacillus capsici]
MNLYVNLSIVTIQNSNFLFIFLSITMNKTEISKKGGGFLCWRDMLRIDSGHKIYFYSMIQLRRMADE